MLNQLFSEATKIQQLNVEAALTNAAYPASGSFIDVSQYERFAFLVAAGVLDDAITCQVRQATAANGTPKDVTDAVVVIPANGDNKWYLVEVQTDHLDINNGYHYVNLTLSGIVDADDFGALLFLGINPGEKPVTQGADCGAIVSVVG